jgi:hypothetical protein
MRNVSTRSPRAAGNDWNFSPGSSAGSLRRQRHCLSCSAGVVLNRFMRGRRTFPSSETTMLSDKRSFHRSLKALDDRPKKPANRFDFALAEAIRKPRIEASKDWPRHGGFAECFGRREKMHGPSVGI